MRHLNYNHLLYFWMVGREGTIARAAELLHLTPQTVSGQLKLLDAAVGTALFERRGRHLQLTEAGRTVFGYADEMFRLGNELVDVMRGRTPGGQRVFTVGVADVVPKLVAYRMLEPALSLSEPMRLVCHEGKLERLLADLSVHRLDLVLADSPVSPSLNLRVFNHPLGETGVSFFAHRERAARLRRDFPGSLDGEPMLLPTSNTALRRGIDLWLTESGIAPLLVAEFDDSALMRAFGQSGRGVFPGPTAIESEVLRQHEVELIGRAPTVRERFYAISAERRIRHPAVIAISNGARQLFAELGKPAAIEP